MTDLDQLAYLGLPCSFCGADPGTWCVTARPYSRPPGQRAAYLHDARTRLLYEAWRAGRTSAEAMVYGRLAQLFLARANGEWWARETPTDLPGLARWLSQEEARARG